MATALVDELIEGFDNKYLVIGFDTNRNDEIVDVRRI
jgi:hypothetical protein